jgi:hypothetical protein
MHLTIVSAAVLLAVRKSTAFLAGVSAAVMAIRNPSILAAVFAATTNNKLFCKTLVSLVYVLFAALGYRKLNCKTPCCCLCSIQNAKRRLAML